jgi:uncharacterized protein YdcH (DUF465 family)
VPFRCQTRLIHSPRSSWISRGRIHALELFDPHFARLVAGYEQVDREVCCMEGRLGKAAKEARQAMRRLKVRIKDQILEAVSRPAV